MHAELDTLDETSETQPIGYDLPPIQPLKRTPCGVCRRKDRPVWSGVCSWCAEKE